MINVYDIIINLLDGDRVYESFEWEKKDNIEHVKKIPMIRVSTQSLYDIVNKDIVVDKSFLDKIYRKAQIYNDDLLSIIDYACLFTDTYKVVAVEFNKEGKSLFKSYLLMDEEDEILELSNEIKLSDIKYNALKDNNNLNYLTRKEEFRKNYLLKELKTSYKKKKYEKLNYLYEEVYGNDDKNIKDKYYKLIDDISNDYSFEYDKIYNILRLTNTKKTTSN